MKIEPEILRYAQNEGSVWMLRNQGKGKKRVKADCHAPLHHLKAQVIATAGARNDECILIRQEQCLRFFAALRMTRPRSE